MARLVFRPTSILGAVALLLGGLSVAGAQDRVSNWLPADTNTVAVVRVGELLNSQLGRSRRWLDEYRDAYAAGTVSAPPSVLQTVRATEYRPHSKGAQPVYSINTMRVDVSMRDIAAHELSQIEKIGDAFAVLSHRGVYFARLGNRLLGALQPGDRQLLARWLRDGAANQKSQVSAYLTEIVEAESGPQVVIAIDLADMIEPTYFAKWIAASPALKAAKIDPAKVTEQLASLRGLRLSAMVSNQITAQLALDFTQPVDSANKDALHAIVMEWLDNSGARMDALAHAESSVKGNVFALDTALDEQGLRRILSLIQSPHPTEPSTEQGGNQEANVIASLRYYQGVVAAVNDLSARKRRATDYEKTALWHENFAARIEGLSTRGVDPELSAWGYEVAQKLRALASSLRGLPVQVDKLNRAIRYDVRTYNRRIATTEWGGIFRPEWFTVESNLQDVRAAQQDLVAQDEADRTEIWNMLEQDRVAIVRRMQEKFGVDFEKK